MFNILYFLTEGYRTETSGELAVTTVAGIFQVLAFEHRSDYSHAAPFKMY